MDYCFTVNIFLFMGTNFRGLCKNIIVLLFLDFVVSRCRRGPDRMVVGFIATYAIRAYHH
jgi:hypothetical protein